jgi:taurine--2-oxoglutarate transaminase
MDLDELVFHPWTVQGPRTVPTFVSGSGSHVVDAGGRRYLDFSSQLVFTNLGHQHPRVVAAIKAQADRLCTLAPGHASDVSPSRRRAWPATCLFWCWATASTSRHRST